MSINSVDFESRVVSPSVKRNNILKKNYSLSRECFDKFETKKTSTAKKIGIATAILATLATIATIAITKGKAARKTKLLSQIPKDLQVKFEKIKKLNGEDFTNRAYGEIVDYMGLKGIAPNKILFEGKGGFMGGIQGGYDPSLNTITFTKNFINANKDSQISMLAHELTHCRQFTNMLRTEGIGVEKFVETQVKNTFENALRNDILFKIKFENAKKIGQESQFIKVVKETWTQQFTERINKNFADVLKLPKIKADSSEGVKAFSDLKAYESYPGLGMFGMGSDAYRNSPLEIEAYGFGDKMKDLFNKFLKANSWL